MNVLNVQNLNAQYHTEKGSFDAVSGFSLSMEEGEITGLVGQSGCGKSTAVRAIMGISAENAEVEYENLSLDGEIPVPGHNIAMIFQDSQNCLNPSVKIGKQIAETVRNRRKCTRKEAVKRALELLDLVGIRNPALRMKQYPFELSGGMQQRVVIAIALACDPRLIIADEPTTALDGAVQTQILGLLRKVVRETKTALLLVSHDLGVIASLCSRVYVMEKGQVVESGTAEEIFYSPEQEYTKQLIKNAGKMHFRTEKEKAAKEILLRTEHLTKEYHTKEGIRDLSFELYKGETFALVGESGSGKTTLARILSGILKPDSGMIDDRSKTRAQMVFQDPYGALNPCLTVGQAMEEAIRKTVPDPRLRRQKAEDTLRLSGLRETVRNRYPRELSGGERQRAGIARALVCDPELLICDEAFSSLDASTRDGLLELFGTLQREQALTCLFISHDMKAVARISGRMGVLFRGELVEMGRTRSVCTDPWHPYTKQLLLSMPAPDPLRAGRKKGIPFREKSTEPPGRNGGAHSGCPFAENCPYAMDCCREETPDSYVFGERTVKCFLYSEEHSGRRAEGYKMTSQI